MVTRGAAHDHGVFMRYVHAFRLVGFDKPFQHLLVLAGIVRARAVNEMPSRGKGWPYIGEDAALAFLAEMKVVLAPFLDGTLVFAGTSLLRNRGHPRG